MNPGYAGRTELPESVKALFRPVVVIVPDLQQICEIMLFSEGFLLAKVLAKKMTVLYKLAKEQLSRQYHYDFGLRALKAVLVMAGELKRGSPDLNEVGACSHSTIFYIRTYVYCIFITVRVFIFTVYVYCTCVRMYVLFMSVDELSYCVC